MGAERQDGVEEFAALLRRLKERTDRSYGSLARRLHMNTSTLHRYCAGDAVPVDFAPVERFAALCGATAEERLELHRHWMAAVAARRRAQKGPLEAGPATPSEASADEGRPGDTQDTAPGEDAAEPHPVEDAAEPHPVEDAAEPHPVEDAAEPHPGEDAAGGEDATAARPAQAPPVTEPDAPSPLLPPAPHRSPSPSPWYRRRRTTVAAAASAALLVALGGLSALSANRSPADDGARAAAPSGPAAAPHARPRPSDASRSPSPGTGSPSASGGAKRPAPQAGRTAGGPRVAPSEEATGSPGAATGTPLTWTADSHVWAGGCGHDYVIGASPARVPPPPAPQDAATWAATQRAVHGRETMVEISVQGRSSTAVVLEALRVRVVGRTDPAPGSVYAMDQGCGGSLTPRHFAVDLDKDRPIARPVGGNDAGTPVPAVRMPYRVSAEDPEVLLVTARTGGCDCRWYLELDWSSQGRTGTVRVDADGRPFRTSAIDGLPRYLYDTSARAWTTYTP
ncbi:transcriptional regulator [Streptomyces sp. DH24]|uniref:transcriptional regulator n=1 Tax=Streptomyces sp. DH24 TaxID=3040123 RepID=UPI00244106DE|nr:transcriptional regulator [Streptomyces sp. DH24]MDG9717775.1 helix-turn-helix domain-containing protein [Streptomyces sp. DH24]